MPGSEKPPPEWADAELHEVAGYRLLRRVGVGAMSAVYLSHDVAAGEPVAVKLLADHLAPSQEFVNRFYREARLSRLLSHPNLVKGLGAGFDPTVQKHYLILEFIDGPTAHAALTAHGRFPVGVAVKVGIDIASALAFLHDRHYVHRDVKPDNILLHPDGVAKLADLGLAKRLNDDQQLTAFAQGVGTSYYMAYEQSLNSNLVDGRSDIFSLGATLYHLLAGEVPFPGATHEDVMWNKSQDDFPPVTEHNPDVPAELAQIISVMLARDPRSRYQSAEEVVEALEATGLATAPPFFGGNPSGSPAVEIPTRADLKTYSRGGNATPVPRSESFAANPDHSPKHPANESLRGSGRSVAVVVALLLGASLATAFSTGVFSRRAAKPPAPTPTVTKELPAGSPSAGGLPAPLPQ